MKSESTFKKLLFAFNHFIIFFGLVAFVITCTLTLFLTVMAESMGIVLNDENISVAAKLGFINVIILSVIFTVIDSVRRRITVYRPVKIITDAAAKMAAGDFSVRIPKIATLDTDNQFNEIADCFNKMAEELSGTETLRADFISNVSHELKTPLAVMKNYGTLLKAPNLSEEKRVEYATAITDAAGRLATLITNILKLNKLENQQITPNKEIYDLGEQLCECLLGFEEAWEKKELDIETDVEDGVFVNADCEMMSLVCNNLFSNAIKFTEPGGKIYLSVKREGEFAEVVVKDSGVGISSDVGKHIFDKFYQGDTSHATEGNGLGLALVKRVIDISGSDISVESEIGIGTTFTVKMPVEKSMGKSLYEVTMDD